MLKFEKNGKKVMEMKEDGEMIFYDAAFKEKMKLEEVKVKGNKDDKEK